MTATSSPCHPFDPNLESSSHTGRVVRIGCDTRTFQNDRPLEASGREEILSCGGVAEKGLETHTDKQTNPRIERIFDMSKPRLERSRLPQTATLHAGSRTSTHDAKRKGVSG